MNYPPPEGAGGGSIVIFKKEDGCLWRRRQLSLEKKTVVFGKDDKCLWKIGRATYSLIIENKGRGDVCISLLLRELTEIRVYSLNFSRRYKRISLLNNRRRTSA